MSLARLNRLFAADGRCLIVAVDHGLFREPSWLGHIRDMPHIIASQIAAGPDAITLAGGQAPLLQGVQSRAKPALVMRADLTNAYTADRAGPAFCFRLEGAVERAVALDAACVVAAILELPGQPELYAECLRNVAVLRGECDRVGMALMVEVLAMSSRDGVPDVVEDARTIATLARQAAELGADVIKTDPTTPVEDYVGVVEAGGGRPVLASGGSPVQDDRGPGAVDAAVIRRTEAILATGAAGVSYGRPIVWAADPPAMTRALAQVVHGGVTADEAIRSMAGAAGAAGA